MKYLKDLIISLALMGGLVIGVAKAEDNQLIEIESAIEIASSHICGRRDSILAFSKFSEAINVKFVEPDDLESGEFISIGDLKGVAEIYLVSNKTSADWFNFKQSVNRKAKTITIFKPVTIFDPQVAFEGDKRVVDAYKNVIKWFNNENKYILWLNRNKKNPSKATFKEFADSVTFTY